MRWRWIAISPEINLELRLDSDDEDVIRRVEESARLNGIVLVRIEDEAERESR